MPKNEYSNSEFIKLNRKILEWEWYDDPCTRSLFIHCLLKANWKPGIWHGHKCERGQFITSLSNLASELGQSVKQIRTALDRLKQTGELADEYNTKFRIITVKNYDKYQSEGKPHGKPKGKPAAGEGQADGQSKGNNRRKSTTYSKKRDKEGGCAALCPSGVDLSKPVEVTDPETGETRVYFDPDAAYYAER